MNVSSILKGIKRVTRKEYRSVQSEIDYSAIKCQQCEDLYRKKTKKNYIVQSAKGKQSWQQRLCMGMLMVELSPESIQSLTHIEAQNNKHIQVHVFTRENK